MFSDGFEAILRRRFLAGNGKESHDILPEKEVTPANLRDLFKTALYKAELDDDGDVKVVTDSGMNVFVIADESRTMLKYLTAYGLKEAAPESQKLELINTLNNTVVFARFSMPLPDAIVADYFLLYEQGITPFQIVKTLRLFDRVVLGALCQYDKHDLVA